MGERVSKRRSAFSRGSLSRCDSMLGYTVHRWQYIMSACLLSLQKRTFAFLCVRKQDAKKPMLIALTLSKSVLILN